MRVYLFVGKKRRRGIKEGKVENSGGNKVKSDKVSGGKHAPPHLPTTRELPIRKGKGEGLGQGQETAMSLESLGRSSIFEKGRGARHMTKPNRGGEKRGEANGAKLDFGIL